MNTIWSAFGRFFGQSHNDRFAELIRQLADIAVECAAHLRSTRGRDLTAIVAYERRADQTVDAVHELLDDTFILRFDVQDAMELTDEIDNVIDGMRKVASHLDIYRAQLSELSDDAIALIALSEKAIIGVRDLAGMLTDARLDLSRVRQVADRISVVEAEADSVVAAAERRLVEAYSPAGANRLGFIAWSKLYELLEGITDDAKHVAKLILSLARKES